MGAALLCARQTSAGVVQEAKNTGIARHALEKALGGGIPGAVAGVVQVSTLMWMRTALNFQYRYGVSFFDACETLWKDGGVRRFYNGLTFALLQGPLNRFGATAANDGMMALLGGTELPLSIKTGAGSLVAAAWRVGLLPVDTCKTVLQVHGRDGVEIIRERIASRSLLSLYQGSIAVWVIAVASHFPWFFTHNVLDEAIALPPPGARRVLRNAFIGFVSSVVSDAASNSARVIKIMKQSSTDKEGITYREAIGSIVKEHGIMGLLGRGLYTRILVNAVQSVVFTIVWKSFTQRGK